MLYMFAYFLYYYLPSKSSLVLFCYITNDVTLDTQHNDNVISFYYVIQMYKAMSHK